MTRRALVALTALAVTLTPTGADGQQRTDLDRCVFDNTPQTTMVRELLPTGHANVYLGRGVFVRCPGKSLTLRADSLVSYEAEGRLHLIGHVHYEEPRLALTSDFLTYYQQFERVVATSNVVATLPNGSTLRGPTVDYYRAIAETRPARMVATQRPTIHILQKDSSGAADTLVVNADRVTMVGDSLAYANGNVVMTRPEVVAQGDSLFIDSAADLMVLMRQPVITGRGDRAFTLTGVRIEISARNRELERVLAMGNGKAVSQDVTLTSDTIDLRVVEDQLSRAIAWGPGRARATSATQEIEADSIDVRMPGQRIRELFAVRGAVATSDPDTTRYKADSTDSLGGDLIIARFDSTASDTSQAQLRELAAVGTARSYYHMAPADTTILKAAVNYVRGGSITVVFDRSRASSVTVVGKATGMHLEPKPDPKPRP